MAAGPWNWLEVAKLIAGLLIPIALALLGVYIHRVTKRFEHLQWRSQKLIEKRLAVYDDIAPHLNDLMCYFTYVGCWKDLAPPDVVALKRDLDKKIHLAAPLFSKPFFDACMKFQSHCFETYTGWGQDARLRTKWERRREAAGAKWKTEWATCFSESAAEPKEIRSAYRAIMEAFAMDIGVHSSYEVPDPGRIPANIR